MSPLGLGMLIGLVTVLVLAIGVPVAFGLGFVALLFLLLADGPAGLAFVAETFFSSLADFTLVAIPMFIFMGTAVASSPAGSDLYAVLDRWIGRVPGGLVVSNIGACMIFSALSGSSPATCAAIGKMGIPEMRQRGFPADLAAGAIAAGGTLGILIPPSVTMIVYGVSTGTSIGRLFIAGLVPGVLLTALFAAWAVLASRRSENVRPLPRFGWRERFELLPKVLPFVVIIVAILYVLYGGIATPSEAAGVGALFCLGVVALAYGRWRPRHVWEILRSSTRESVMIMMIIGASGLFSYMLSSLFVTQSLAAGIAELDVHPWVLLALVNVLLLAAGFFLPPVAVILMTAPILLPIIDGAGFDPYWFGVVMTINLEIGLITPPVGLNLYVINGIAPDIPLRDVLRGALPFVALMVLGIVLLCVFPGIATWLPDALMGPS